MTFVPKENGASWDRTLCPSAWTGHPVALADERVFVCGSCRNPGACAERDRCIRELDHKRAMLPRRIALCPDCAAEFYYPLKAGEGLSCPVCSLEMVVYERAAV